MPLAIADNAVTKAFQNIGNEWALLTAGDAEHFNTMTTSDGQSLNSAHRTPDSAFPSLFRQLARRLQGMILRYALHLQNMAHHPVLIPQGHRAWRLNECHWL